MESILEDPDIILRKQLDRLKTKRMAEMKPEGIEYDQRIAELEKLEYPKPQRDFIYGTFNDFADQHPWVGEENIRPKSIAREMFEDFRSFADYVRDYDLQRAEGLLLRHLNSVYKVLAQTVPDGDQDRRGARDGALPARRCSARWTRACWTSGRRCATPAVVREETKEVRPPRAEEAAGHHPRRKAFTAAIRNRIFTFLRSLVLGDDEALASSRRIAWPTRPWTGEPWTADRLQAPAEAPTEPITAGSASIPKARNLRHTYVLPSEDARTWRVQQMLVDPEDHNDWVVELEVDLAASRETGEPVLELLRLGSLT